LRAKYPTYSEEQVLKAAGCYGWTPTNRKQFSKAIIVQYDKKPQETICPNCKAVLERDGE
jgi:hypothetical protein